MFFAVLGERALPPLFIGRQSELTKACICTVVDVYKRQVCTALGVVIERLAYKPLRMAPSLAVLITAIGVSYFLQNAALLIWGSGQKSFTSVVKGSPFQLFDGQLTVTPVTLVTVLACIVIRCV